MGFYINPPNMSKEHFLEKHGKRVDVTELVSFNWSSDSLPVCLVNNGFTAAGICYNEHEFEAFNHPHDTRRKLWYVVSKEDLSPYYKGNAS